MVDESFFDYLKSETGIDVDAFTGSVSDLLRRGFRKLSPEELAKRVLVQEHLLFWKTLKDYAENFSSAK